MKRFVWRLQRVLDIKTKEEQTKRAELLKLTEKLAETRGKLLVQQNILKNIISRIIGEEPRKRLGKQEFFLKCSVTTDELIKKLKEQERELETQQRAKIAEVLKIRRFRKGLEKLRSDAKREFIRSEERLEQKESDEGATLGFARKKIKHKKIKNY